MNDNSKTKLGLRLPLLLTVAAVSLLASSACSLLNPPRFGYINKQGEMVIAPQFDYADHFHEGLARVRVNGKVGFIDKTGKMVISGEYDGAGHFSQGMCPVSFHCETKNETDNDQKWGYIDKTGQLIIPAQFSIATPFSAEGLAWVVDLSTDTRAGLGKFIDKQGNEPFKMPVEIHELVNSWSNDETKFSDGLTPLGDWGKMGAADPTGKWIIPPKFYHVDSFSDGLASFSTEDKLYGYINKSGKIVVQPVFTSAGKFHEGKAAVSSKESQSPAFINADGKTMIKPTYADARWWSTPMPNPPPSEPGLTRTYFSNGRVLVQAAANQSRFLFLNEKGEPINKTQYADARPFREQFAAVAHGEWKEEPAVMDTNSVFHGKWGYIDINGTQVIPAKFDKAGDFSEGLAPVAVSN